ncbi:MAG: DNA polymerase III subunit alpha, partial [Chloroflexi bacterium]|nr:DNA polymerase III subunit alpha [Chloroflexota bacterium]
LTNNLDYHFPDYPVPPEHTPQSYLEELCRQAAVRRYGGVTDRVEARLREELRLIERHSLAGFLLLYHDIIQMARQVMIDLGLSDPEIPLEERPPGRGRGSSVAMVVGYLIGLSHIDPMEYNLSLDRFLQDEMPSVPDIDLDFPRDIREELIKRVHERWGWDHAALTGMISTYKIKGAIRDLGKALGLPFQDVDKLAKTVESHSAGALEAEMLRTPEFRDRTDAPVWRDLIDLAGQLDGFPKYLAQHPGGMIISSSPLIEMVPVQPGAIDDRYLCHWDKDSIADAGFVKIDFLALGALSQMQDALQLIESRTGHYIDLSRIDVEDKAVYDMLHRADTIGIFQVESAAQMQTIIRIKPRNLTEMAYEVGAVRPGVGVNDGVTKFIRRHSLGVPWEYDHPLERKALERTLGIILFQDQVNQVAIDVAGFGAAEADQLRRAFSRKNSESLIEVYKEKFLAGAAERGVPKAAAEKIFKKFNGQYMFPESHAFAFGVTAYHMAWLKYYYPLEFFVAIFNQQPMGFYNLETLKEDARRHGVTVLNPDINTSVEKCIIASVTSETDSTSADAQEALLVGFLNVKGIGKAQAEAIVEAREQYGKFSSVADAMRRTGLKRESIENLVLAGAFDSLTTDRRSTLWEVGLRYRPVPAGAVSARKSKSSGNGLVLPGTTPRLHNGDVPIQKIQKKREWQQPLELPVEQDMADLAPMTAWDRMAGEYQTMSLYPKGHLMNHIRPKLPSSVLPSDEIPHLKDGMEVWTAGLVIRRQRPLGKAVFITLEDEFGHIPLIVWPAVYARYRLVLREPVLMIRGTVSRREGTMNIMVTHAESLHTLKDTPTSKNWG